MSGKLFDSTIGAINTSLNLRQLNQNVIGSNIANADTPGYKSKKVEFETAFRDALDAGSALPMEVTSDKHIVPRETDPVYPEIFDETNGVESLDGNTVDRAEQMARMSENQIMYSASVEMLRKKLGMLKFAIDGGER